MALTRIDTSLPIEELSNRIKQNYSTLVIQDQDLSTPSFQEKVLTITSAIFGEAFKVTFSHGGANEITTNLSTAETVTSMYGTYGLVVKINEAEVSRILFDYAGINNRLRLEASQMLESIHAFNEQALKGKLMFDNPAIKVAFARLLESFGMAGDNMAKQLVEILAPKFRSHLKKAIANPHFHREDNILPPVMPRTTLPLSTSHAPRTTLPLQPQPAATPYDDWDSWQ